MLKFMLLDLFSFRFVGSKLEIMQIMNILNILTIMKIIKIIKIVIMDLYYWRSRFCLPLALARPIFCAFLLFLIGFCHFLSKNIKKH